MPAFKKILFIDDDYITVNISHRMMSLVDFAGEFVSCEDGAQAKDYLLNNKNALPDLIFVDLHMTVMNGWEFLSWFEVWCENENITLPIYVLSSSLSKEDFDQAKGYNRVMGYIIKPLTVPHLHAAIERFAHKHA